MIDSVEAVATNSLRKPFVRPRVHKRGFGQPAMEASVKHRDLENGTKSFLNDLHPFQLRTVMKRREVRHAGNCRSYFWSDDNRLLVVLPSVHDPVTDHIDLGRR